MSTHAYPETTPAPTPTTESQPEETEPEPLDPFDAHDPSATFDASDTDRLPNTADEANERVGH